MKPETTVLIPEGVLLMEVFQPEEIANPISTRVFQIDGPLKVFIVSFADLEVNATRLDE